MLNWLLDGPSWLEFAVRKNILGECPDAKEAACDAGIIKIVQAIKNDEIGFPAVKYGGISYKKELFWYTRFLADIGFNEDDLGLNEYFDSVLFLEDDGHNFMLAKEMKPEYYCISSVLLSGMAMMSDRAKERLYPHTIKLMDSMRKDGGWHCAKSRAMGAKLEDSDSCPMDIMNVLHLLGQFGKYRDDSRLNGAQDFLLNHWNRRDEPFRPYGFGIGTDFKKLKYPAVKYGILQVLDTLSLFPYSRKKDEFKEMMDIVRNKRANGLYIPESVMKMFDGFDFGQKKEPSLFLTYLIGRIESRIENVV